MAPLGNLDAAILALAGRVDLAFAFLLLLARFTICFSLLPGIGQGASGLAIRGSAIVVLAGASLLNSTIGPVPESWGTVLIMFGAEASLGLVLGIIPQMVVAAAHLAGSLCNTAMGLGAAQMFDPTLGDQASSLGRMYGDLAILIFLLMDGHHAVIFAATGLANTLPPGVFSPSSALVMQVAAATGIIFKVGVLISAPIVSTLLITQCVLGILSKTIPSINVFFVSFPITVGVGLTLASASLPSVIVVLERATTDMGNLLVNTLR